MANTTEIPAAPPSDDKVKARRALRDAFGSFVTGVTVVTTRDVDGNMAGCTANSFSSVSINPPLVLWSLSQTSNSYPVFANSTRFTINVLAEGQRHLSQLFASQGSDRFGNSAWTPGLGGVPVLDGALCYLECVKYASYPGGDHTIFVGQVENFQRKHHRPLVFGGGRYLMAFEDSLGGTSKELLEGNRARFDAEKLAIALLPEISQKLGRSVAVAMWGNEGPVVLYWEINHAPVTEGIQTANVCSLIDTATGRAFAAYLPPEVTAKTRALHLARSSWTEQDHDALLREVRRNGFARALSEETKLITLSVPVYDESGLMMLALTTVLPLGDTTEASASQLLLEQAEGLSRKLGFSREPGASRA